MVNLLRDLILEVSDAAGLLEKVKLKGPATVLTSVFELAPTLKQASKDINGLRVLGGWNVYVTVTHGV